GHVTGVQTCALPISALCRDQKRRARRAAFWRKRIFQLWRVSARRHSRSDRGRGYIRGRDGRLFGREREEGDLHRSSESNDLRQRPREFLRGSIQSRALAQFNDGSNQRALRNVQTDEPVRSAGYLERSGACSLGLILL